MSAITTIIATEDTHVSQSSPNSNYGTSELLNVLGYTSGYWNRAFLKFPLPSEIIGKTIIKATFYVYYFSNDDASRPQRHRIKRVTSDWNETIATWNNQPTFYGSGSLDTGAYALLSAVSSYVVKVWRTADITTLVQEWASGIYPNFGICIDTVYYNSVDGGYWASINYCSKDNANSSLRPYLVIEYEEVNSRKRKFAQII